jgi:hypothetical protein
MTDQGCELPCASRRCSCPWVGRSRRSRAPSSGRPLDHDSTTPSAPRPARSGNRRSKGVKEIETVAEWLKNASTITLVCCLEAGCALGGRPPPPSPNTVNPVNHNGCSLSQQEHALARFAECVRAASPRRLPSSPLRASCVASSGPSLEPPPERRARKGKHKMHVDARSQRPSESGRRDSRHRCAAAGSPTDPRSQSEKASRRITVMRRPCRSANPRVIRRRCSLARPLTPSIDD